MPRKSKIAKIEKDLRRSAKRAGLKPDSKRFKAYVYGSLRRIKDSICKRGKGKKYGVKCKR